MAGSVWEWCATKWQKPYPYDVQEEDEWSVEYLRGDRVRVLRGGSWFDNQDLARCAARLDYLPIIWVNDTAFRLVSPI